MRSRTQNEKFHMYGISILLALVTVAFGYLVVRQSTEIVALATTLSTLTRDVAKLRVDLAHVTTKVMPDSGTATSNLFYSTTAKPGDVVAGMTIVSIKPLFDRSGQPLGPENVQATFSGTVTLKGTYDVADVGGINGKGHVCFLVGDAMELAKLPRLQEDVMVRGDQASFCFADQQKAQSVFGMTPGNGSATVTVKEYVLARSFNDSSDSAALVSVVDKSAPSRD